MDEKTYHLIDQYLSGELVGRALDEFKVRLKDPEFKKAVDQQAQIIAAVEEVRKAELKQYINEHKKVGYIQNQWGNRWTYASAAIVLLFVSAFFIVKFYIDKPTELASSEADDQPIVQIDSGQTSLDSQTLAIEDQAPSNPMLIEEDLADENLSASEDEAEEEQDADLDGVDDDTELAEEISPEAVEDGQPTEPVELDVRKDEKIGSTVVQIPNYSPSFSGERFTETSTSKRAANQDSGQADELEDSERPNADKEEVKQLKLNVEYWKSPVNFEGYQYDGSVLKLYEIDQKTSTQYIQLDDRLYLKMGKEYYFLEKNGEYNKFVPVTNKTLLKVLNE